MVNKLDVYSTLFLTDEKGKVLLLKRASWKKFMPDKYTGVGGHVEANEFADLQSAGTRELEEETSIKAADVKDLQLKLTLLVINRDGGDHCLYYYLGKIDPSLIKDLSCNEGELEWHHIDDLDKVDFISTIGSAYKYLFDDSARRFTAVFDVADNQLIVKATV